MLFDIEKLYPQTFGSTPYKVPALTNQDEPSPAYTLQGKKNDITQVTGSTLLTQFNGVEIWLPVWFRGLPAGIGENGVLFLPYTVVKIQGKKTIVSTPMMERRGTVKEVYNIDDYSISIKGFLIDANRQWPEKELTDMRKLFELNQSVVLDNALVNVFLNQTDKVVIKSLDLPEVEGGRKHVRPFAMELESDSVFVLTLK